VQRGAPGGVCAPRNVVSAGRGSDEDVPRHGQA
jgi:hypothetical protein